ncbi:hypothetical protein MMAD_46370 [Mycolicibacterium madagascariense]|uniref:Uncharacterized protein n=1 Tax=Mycolicibacterium madagascariense TaxID=212765 RepID=A0A7I7XMR4_9MYCO|nr:hypothetical protein MMAD_46370 [Mycolicibacterium madagascariense]
MGAAMGLRLKNVWTISRRTQARTVHRTGICAGAVGLGARNGASRAPTKLENAPATEPGVASSAAPGAAGVSVGATGALAAWALSTWTLAALAVTAGASRCADDVDSVPLTVESATGAVVLGALAFLGLALERVEPPA